MELNSIADIANAAAEQLDIHFHGADDSQQPVQWAVPLDSQHQVGMTINAHDGCMIFSVWRRSFNNKPDVVNAQDEALLRRGFNTRLGAGLIGGSTAELGHSLNLPLYGACDVHALQYTIEILARELDRLEREPGSRAPALPPFASDARYQLGNAAHAEHVLARFAQSCGVDAMPPGTRQFDVLFDDLPGRIKLHPSARLLLADFFIHDLAMLQGAMRHVIVKSALLINQAALRGRSYVVSLDSRDFLVGTGRILLEGLNDELFSHWLQYQVMQALDMRALVKRLSLEGAQISLTPEGKVASIELGALS